MTHNNALLRLAKIVESIASGDGPHWPTEDVRQLIRDLEAAPQSALERRTITLEEWAMFIAALDHYVAHYGNRSGVEDEALARAMLKSPLRLTVEDA